MFFSRQCFFKTSWNIFFKTNFSIGGYSLNVLYGRDHKFVTTWNVQPFLEWTGLKSKQERFGTYIIRGLFEIKLYIYKRRTLSKDCEYLQLNLANLRTALDYFHYYYCCNAGCSLCKKLSNLFIFVKRVNCFMILVIKYLILFEY